MRRKLAMLVILTVLVGILGLACKFQNVKASGTIYIRANGAIEPQTANITSSDNVTYTFIGNISDPIVDERDNIVVDGAGYTLQGPGSGTGIYLTGYPTGRSNVTIKNTRIKAFGCGISLSYSSNNTISENNITNSGGGICLSYSSNNTVSGNSIKNIMWGFGIYLFYSSNNTISGNSITDTIWNGILLDSSNANNIYHNNLVNNTRQISTYGLVNVWDDGVEGNYWSNYTGVDLDHDGIGDSPHIIDVNNTDNHPLMGMFHSFNTSLGYKVNVISNSTIENFQYLKNNSTIRMSVSNMTTNQTFGFVRICISHALMNETYHVTVDGAEPYYVNYTLYDNGTHRWMYFSYEHSTLEIIIVPEFPSFLIPPLFMIGTLLAVMVYGRKHTVRQI